MDPDEFLILTRKGLEFVKRWFLDSVRVPPELTREYQLLLHICCFEGLMKYEMLKEIGYKDNTIGKALGEKLVFLSKDGSKLEEEVKAEIAKMIEKSPESLYA